MRLRCSIGALQPASHAETSASGLARDPLEGVAELRLAQIGTAPGQRQGNQHALAALRLGHQGLGQPFAPLRQAVRHHALRGLVRWCDGCGFRSALVPFASLRTPLARCLGHCRLRVALRLAPQGDLLAVACGIEVQRPCDLAVAARHRGHRTAEGLAPLAGGVLRGTDTQVARGGQRQRREAVGRLHDADDRELVAQGIGPGLDRLQGQFLEMARVLAVALAQGFGEQARLPRRVVRAAAARRRVEDRIGQLTRIATQLRFEHGHRHLLRQDALEHGVLLVGGNAREQFGVAEQDGAAGQRLQHGRRTGQQRQPPLQHVGRPAHEAGGFLLVAALAQELALGRMGFLGG